MKNIIFLALAIIAEVAGTTALKISEQFTKPMHHRILIDYQLFTS